MQIQTMRTNALLALCTLSDSQLTQRLAEIRRDILPHVLQIQTSDDGFTLELRDAPGLKPKVERIIALEQQCCAGALQLDLIEKPQSNGLALDVKGIRLPKGTLEKMLDEIKEAPNTSFRSPGLRRALSSGGIGVIGAFIVFCGMPIALAALLGASPTAYLAKLDNPYVVGIGALVFGGAAWWFQKRRSANQATVEQRAGCGC